MSDAPDVSPPPAAPKPPLWILVDGNNYLHRYWSVMGAGCTRAIMAMMHAYRDQWSPLQMVVCFDAPPSFRVTVDVEYKANRADVRTEIETAGLADEFARFRAALLRDGFGVESSQGYEADDCIATLTRIAVSHGSQVIIASGDKDLRQLLREGQVTLLVNSSRAESKLVNAWMTAGQLFDAYGLVPAQWVDYQCLVGDKTDNIVGATGIGNVAAKKILQACESIDGYYENVWAAKLGKSQMRSMTQFRSRYATVKRLVLLRRDVPIAARWMEGMP